MNAKESLTALHLLADRAGLMVNWTNAAGEARQVEPAVLRSLLETFGLPCATIGQCEASRAGIAADDVAHAIPPMVTALCGESIAVPWAHTLPRHAYRLHLEDGAVITGTAHLGSDGALHVPSVDQAGYHRLHLGDIQITVAVAPHRCFGVADAFGETSGDTPDPSGSTGYPPGRIRRAATDEPGPALRRWGLAVQLYGLRRTEPTAIGDFTTLARLCRSAAQAGAQAVAINPVHANFAAFAQRYSPYSPSSRLFLNPLYVDPAALFGQQAHDDALHALGLRQRLAALDAAKEIDWPAVASWRYAVLHWLWHRRHALLPATDMLDYAGFRLRGGDSLEAHARYEAMQAAHLARAPSSSSPGSAESDEAASAMAGDWRQWPPTQRAPQDAAVAAFAHLHAESVDFHAFLQWMAARGLAEAQREARDAGMRIGLIADLAVGTDPGGSQAWSRQDEMLPGICAGAPPDLMNPLGQNWGVGVFSPRGLRKHGYGAFIEMLRANMAHAGGIRIDHALGLARMWLVPDGAPPGTGAYMRYPFEDLLRLIALESWRNKAIVIGENLGTVPPDFNAILAERGVLGIDVLWFERGVAPGADNDNEPHATTGKSRPEASVTAKSPARVPLQTGPSPFLPPDQWPIHAVATTTTHDLPTIAGWWAGRDIEVRARLKQLGRGETEAALLSERARDRDALWQALCGARVASGPTPPPDDAPVDLIIGWMARARTPLRLLPIEDLLAVREQPNVPGTVEGHPNWQRRLDADVQTLFDSAPVKRRVGALTGARHIRPTAQCSANAPAGPRVHARSIVCPSTHSGGRRAPETKEIPMTRSTHATGKTDTTDTTAATKQTRTVDPDGSPRVPAAGRERPASRGQIPARTSDTGTRAQEETGEEKPRLPHERDEFHGSQQSGPRPEVEQASEDIKKGLEDTDLYGSRGKRRPQ